MQVASSCRLLVDTFPSSVEPVPLVRVADDVILDGTVHLERAVKDPLLFAPRCQQLDLRMYGDDVFLSFPVDEEGEEGASCLERELYRHDRRPGRPSEKVDRNPVWSFYYLVRENTYYSVIPEEYQHFLDAAVAVDDPVAVLQPDSFQNPVEIILFHGPGNNCNRRDPCSECQGHKFPIAAMGCNTYEAFPFFACSLGMFESPELDTLQQFFILAEIEPAELGNEDADVDEHLPDYRFR